MPDRAWLDVSVLLGPDTPIFPGDPAIEVGTHASLADGPYHVSTLRCGSHSGTHVDAPAHFVRGAPILAEIPLARWNGPAWVVDCAGLDAIDAGALGERWPDAYVERVLFKTGRPLSGEAYTGLAPDAADWLTSIGVRLVGIDALSIERDETGHFPVHHALLGADCLIVEGLDLAGIDPGPYELVCLPLKLDAPDGAPARAALRPLG